MKRNTMCPGPRIRRAALSLAFAALAVLLGARDGAACSICRCGDPAFNALGLNIYEKGSWRLGLDWDRFEKEQGVSEGEETGGTEKVRENRFTATVSYAATDRLTLMARLPYSSRTLTAIPGAGEVHALHAEDGGSMTGRGLSDPEVYGLFRLWAAPFVGGLGRRAWVGLQVGVKTPWGENNLREDGERLDEHVQPGTGSTDWILGLSGVYVTGPTSSVFSSVQARRPGANDAGYRYGEVSLANLGYERKLGSAVDAVIELNARHAARDRTDETGTRDPNTGGGLVYVTPKLVVKVTSSLVARFSAQIPLIKSLNGDQTERAVYGAGLTWVVGN